MLGLGAILISKLYLVFYIGEFGGFNLLLVVVVGYFLVSS
jgi:hypothetical protein